MIRLFRTTHRATCLEYAQCGDADAQAYAATVAQYFTALTAQAEADDLRLEVVEGDGARSYQAESDAEHQWMMGTLPFWEWYQAEHPFPPRPASWAIRRGPYGPDSYVVARIVHDVEDEREYDVVDDVCNCPEYEAHATHQNRYVCAHIQALHAHEGAPPHA